MAIVAKLERQCKMKEKTILKMYNRWKSFVFQKKNCFFLQCHCLHLNIKNVWGPKETTYSLLVVCALISVPSKSIAHTFLVTNKMNWVFHVFDDVFAKKLTLTAFAVKMLSFCWRSCRSCNFSPNFEILLRREVSLKVRLAFQNSFLKTSNHFAA